MPPIMAEPGYSSAPMDDSPESSRWEGGEQNRYGADGRGAGKRARPGEIDISRLTEAMRASRRALTFFREERKRLVSEFVGSHWAEGANSKRVPVNLLSRYVQVVSRALVPKNPRVMLTTRAREQQPAVAAMQEWMNARIEETYFAETIQRWVIDALFGPHGVMKVAIATPADAAVDGYTQAAGVPFAEAIDLDDFVYDLGCRDLRHASFIGHRYRMPLAVAKRLDYFDAGERKKLVADDSRTTNADGDERIDMLGTGWEATGSNRDFEELVELWEVYLPRTKRVVTMRSDAGGVPASDSTPLRVQEWMGPPCGPYHFLTFQSVPGNALGKGPMMDLIDLHEFVNHLYRKLVNQAQRQKEVAFVSGAQTDDGKKVVQADDGDMVSVDNPAAVNTKSYGGPNAVNANFAVHLKDLFSQQSGNLDLLSGASPQSKTASQDKMLNDNASAGVADMQERTVAGTASVLRAWGWFWWNHPQEVMKTVKALPGLPGIAIERRLHPAGAETPGTPGPGFGGTGGVPPKKAGLTREGRFEDLHCRVDPYSMQYRSPQQRLAFLSTLVKEMSPMMPLLQQQGITFDMQFYLKKVAEYADEPDVAGLFTIQEPVDPEAGGGQRGSSMPPQTERSYVRRSAGADEGRQVEAQFANDAAGEASESQQ